MSGLFGIFDRQQFADIGLFLDASARRMSHKPWHVARSWVAPDLPLGIGHLGIGIFNREPQPIVSAEGIHLWLCGELYHTDELAEELGGGAHSLRDRNDGELSLAAFQRWGVEFAIHMKGAFFIVIFDPVRQMLILANDRFGLYPHYYLITPQGLIFAPEVKGILCAPGVERKLNLTAACEYFRFQQVLGEKTFHEDILLFPYGSTAQLDLQSGEWAIHRYWNWDQVPYRPKVTFDEAVEQSGYLLRSAVQRLTKDDLRPGVFLSGGLDSRTLLGLIPPHPTQPVSATFGDKNSRDVYYARKVARASNSRHYWFDLPDGCWVVDSLDLHLKLTEGFHSWIHMHGITMLEKLRAVMDFNLTGWDGGTVMGHSDHINEVYNFPVDEWTVAIHTYHRFNQDYTWPGLTEPEERLLYSPEYAGQAIGRAFESLRYEFSDFWRFRQEYAAEYFYVVNHCWRSTQQMVTMIRSHLEVRFPFWDYGLIDFMYSLKPHLRRDQLLYRHIITRQTPRLAKIPYDKKEYLPTVNPLLHATHALAVRGLRRLGLYPRRHTLYADYEKYLRNELREWAEGILFDKRTMERGIWDVDFVRSLMNRHLAGHEEWTIGKIAPLITFELMMREYFD